MDHTKRHLTRLDFLKYSGKVTAGFVLLPHAVLAQLRDPRQHIELPAEALAGYQIAISDKASPVEYLAAERLQHYLTEISGKKPALMPEEDYRDGPAFFIGQTRYAKTRKLDLEPLAEDGFIYHPVEKNLIIAGGTGKGTLYGVYGLLELWGCRMFTAAAVHIPKTVAITIPRYEQVVIPVIKYRTTSYRDTRDPGYTDWHRLSSRDDWGLFVHTFNALVPPEQYGIKHPEYYSLVNGSRQPGTQLCLSNPEVLEILITHLKEKMAANPEATYWSVSQNDNDQYCRCGPCTQLNKKYGGAPSGSILYFVNQVARAFPDKIISTLAYWYSRAAPQNIQAEPNVNIMLCNIESKRQEPVFLTDPAFSADLQAWGKLSGNILIWDYNIQFSNLVSPFPNLHTIKPNIKFYTDNHVNSLFMQANSQSGGEMAGLRAYLICKLMWDPDADDSEIMNDFLNGYYGAAGSYILEYINKMRAALLSSGFKLDIFGSPEDAKETYLSAKMMKIYEDLFDKAEKAVEKSPQLLKRVKTARLPVIYAKIQIGRNEVDTPRSLFVHTGGNQVIARPGVKSLVSEFVRLCREEGVTRLRERSITPDDYLASYERIFKKMDEMKQAISPGKKIHPITLPVGGSASLQRLTDGIFGSFESWRDPGINWVPYKGLHMDFILDLGKIMAIKSVSMDFLNAQAQPDWNLLVLPRYVTYATSTDGKIFGKEIRVDNPHNPNPKENPDITKVQVQSFRADLGNETGVRYLRVHGESILKMPSWHIRTGEPAWIYTDEIVVT